MMKKLFSRCKSIKINQVLVFLLLISAFWVLSKELYSRLVYESQGPYTWDTSIYWAIGRGILNGYVPWVDLFETKPPGIFLLSAFSFWLIDDVGVTHLGQIVSILIVALTPVLGVLLLKKRTFWTWIAAAGFGVIIALYAAERSGEVQVESFGAAFGSLYILLVYASRKEEVLILPYNTKSAWLQYLFKPFVLSLFLLGSCGFKEIFLFVILACSIVLSMSWRHWIRVFLIPFIFAASLGVLLLLSLGWLNAYIFDFLKFSSGTHVFRTGSPWLRGWELTHLLNDMKMFSFSLAIIFLVIVISIIWKSWREFSTSKLPNSGVIEKNSLDQEGDIGLLVWMMRWVGALYLVSLSIAFVGDFYNHHHIFAIPFVLAMYQLYQEKTPKPFLIIVCVVIGAFTLPEMNYKTRIHQIQSADQIVRYEAKYVDDVLDALGEKQYLFVGHHGVQLYSHTKHSPMGPLFFQYHEFWENNFRGQNSFWKNLDITKLVVVDRPFLGASNNTFNRILNKDFTKISPAAISGIDRKMNRYQIYFRK